MGIFNTLFGGGDAPQFKATFAKESGDVSRLRDISGRDISGLDATGNKISDIIQKKTADNAGLFASRQQGALQNQTTNAQLAGGLSSGFRNQLIANNQVQTAQGEGQIFGQGLDSQANAAASNLGQQQNFKNNSLFKVADLSQARLNSNAALKNKADAANLQAQSAADSNTGLFGSLASAAVGGFAGGFGKSLFKG